MRTWFRGGVPVRVLPVSRLTLILSLWNTRQPGTFFTGNELREVDLWILYLQ